MPVPDHLVDEANAGALLAEAIDRFYSDLRYTAPEMAAQRINELGSRIATPMRVFGYPKETPATDNTRSSEEAA